MAEPGRPAGARTLFLSDLHLCDERPELTAAFRALLAREAQSADAIYILGDLFEVWVGDDDDAGLAGDVVDILRSAAAQCPVFVMHGNRDFLLRAGFEERTGAALVDDPHVIDLHGRRTVLSHGDALCTADVEYQKVRTMLRSPEWQDGLLAQDLEARRAFAAGARAESRKTNANKASNIMDVTPEAVAALLAEHSADQLVHGHTHRPAVHALAGGRRRVVLGDWDEWGWYAVAERGTLHLERFRIQPA